MTVTDSVKKTVMAAAPAVVLEDVAVVVVVVMAIVKEVAMAIVRMVVNRPADLIVILIVPQYVPTIAVHTVTVIVG